MILFNKILGPMKSFYEIYLVENSHKKPFSLAGKKIWVAGQTGMVGSAVSKRLASEDCELILVKRPELDLRDQKAVRIWLNKNMPDVIVVAAGTVGGILANSSRPAEFLYDNLACLLYTSPSPRD